MQEDVDDLAGLSNLNEDSLNGALGVRYARDCIYVSVRV
jgi:myosin heavy subunit